MDETIPSLGRTNEWLARNVDLKTFLLIFAMVIGWAGSWFTMTARLDDDSRRLENLERSIVPRSEHDVFNAALQERLRGIEARLQDIQTELDRTERNLGAEDSRH